MQTTTPRFSKRGIPLIISAIGISERPLLTVEWASKWYTLQLLKPINNEKDVFELEEVNYHTIQEWFDARGRDINCFVDHVPNPEAVRVYADQHAWDLDEIAEELIVGRWQLEVRDQSDGDEVIVGHIIKNPDESLEVKLYYPHSKLLEPRTVEDLLDVPLTKASEETILAELRTRKEKNELKSTWLFADDGEKT